MVENLKFKIVKDEPKVKYVKYYGEKNLHVLSTIDDDEINVFSEFLIGSITKIFTDYIYFIISTGF